MVLSIATTAVLIKYFEVHVCNIFFFFLKKSTWLKDTRRSTKFSMPDHVPDHACAMCQTVLSMHMLNLVGDRVSRFFLFYYFSSSKKRTNDSNSNDTSNDSNDAQIFRPQ